MKVVFAHAHAGRPFIERGRKSTCSIGQGFVIWIPRIKGYLFGELLLESVSIKAEFGR